MAKTTKTKTTKTKTTKAKTTKKNPAEATLTASERQLLLGLTEAYERKIDHPVSDTEQETRDLIALCVPYGERLHARSRLTTAVTRSLGPRLSLLSRAELFYDGLRHPTLTPAKLKAARGEAQELKSDGVAALRHFFKDDRAVQDQADEIQAGDSLADLVAGLTKLSLALSAKSAGLKKADLPKRAAERAAALAQILGEGSATHHADGLHSEAETVAHALRQRAFWYLRDATDEVRAAGRYVFRKNPKVRKQFAAPHAHPHHARPIEAPEEKKGK